MASKGKKSTQRKLTAILSADVVGYSRLMGADEEATIETLTAYRQVFVSHIESHSGRVVDAKGDAILAEFASVVDAVNSAVEIQRELAEKNTDLSDDRRMDFRIGVNLGDVIVKDDAIYGDGVNVAARLEALAEPGGICISRGAYDQVKAKLELEYEYLGEQEVKNIAEPVRAYQVLSKPGEATNRATEARQEAPGGEATLKVPDKVSIAVLPFANMSGDPEQEYFSDGITEDLITALSNLSRLSVVSRNTAFTYKDKTVNVKEVGKELNVGHVLEGSVRKAGNRVRITAQLIDTAKDRHLWSERYDRTLEDIFAIQDEITHHVVMALNVTLLDGRQAERWRRSTENPEAYYLFLRARSVLQQEPSREAVEEAERLWEQCVELDPGFARAYSALSGIRGGASVLLLPERADFDQALDLAQRAIKMDPNEPHAHNMVSTAHLFKREFDAAHAAAERARELDPDGPQTLRGYAQVHLFAGNLELAEAALDKIFASVPRATPFHHYLYGILKFSLGRIEEAITVLQDLNSAAPKIGPARLVLAAAYAAAGHAQQAAGEAKEALRIEPGLSLVSRATQVFPFRDPARLEHMIALLRKAGLSD